MVMIDFNGKKYYMEKWLTEHLDFLKECVKLDWDAVILIDGVEGSGKSTFAQQIAGYFDPKFNLDKVVFTPEQFVEAVDCAVPGSAILWDEFALAGLSTDAMTKIQGVILKKITTIRKKNLYIIFLMSWIFELRKYFAVGRTRFLLHTYTTDGISRGFFKFWDFDNKRQLYFKGRKNYEYCVRSTLKGRFPNTKEVFFCDADYDHKKDEAIKTIDFETNKDSRFKRQRDILVCELLDRGALQKEVAKLIDITQQNISTIHTNKYSNNTTCI